MEGGKGREAEGKKGVRGRSAYNQYQPIHTHTSQWIGYLPLSCTCTPFAPGSSAEYCGAMYSADFEELQIVMVGIIKNSRVYELTAHLSHCFH